MLGRPAAVMGLAWTQVNYALNLLLLTHPLYAAGECLCDQGFVHTDCSNEVFDSPDYTCCLTNMAVQGECDSTMHCTCSNPYEK